MDGLRVALSTFAAEEGFHEIKTVTCLRAIKFSSMGEKEYFKICRFPFSIYS